jgi:DNA polymerase III epsilon subunit-like protein
MREDVFICVDVETAGPNPADYALLSIGAALVSDPQRSFYVELQPDKDKLTDEAERTHQLDLAALAATGTPPGAAMAQFAAWVDEQAQGGNPVFVAFNAPFDWMFVNDYMQHYLGHNPFGHRALDIKAAFMGFTGEAWAETTYQHISAHYRQPQALAHNARRDAEQGAQLFAAILADLKERANEHTTA